MMEWRVEHDTRTFVWLPNKRAWINLSQVVTAEYEAGQTTERLRVSTTGPHAFYLAGEDAEILDAALDTAPSEEGAKR